MQPQHNTIVNLPDLAFNVTILCQPRYAEAANIQDWIQRLDGMSALTHSLMMRSDTVTTRCRKAIAR